MYNDFKEINIKRRLVISSDEAEIKNLISSSAKIIIINSSIQISSKGKSNEDQRLSGLKLNVKGEIVCDMEYLDTEDKVHQFKKIIPFYTYIILNDETNDCSSYKVTPYIEDILSFKTTSEEIYFNIILLLSVTY